VLDAQTKDGAVPIAAKAYAVGALTRRSRSRESCARLPRGRHLPAFGRAQVLPSLPQRPGGPFLVFGRPNHGSHGLAEELPRLDWYLAEPKLDGQRAQLHVHGGRALGCYSRRALDLLRHPGMAWLRELAWPFDSAVLDGEACAGDGHEGVQAGFVERKRPDRAMAVVVFDVLQVDGRSVMREPWRDSRKRLEDFGQGRRLARAGIVPVNIKAHAKLFAPPSWYLSSRERDRE